jgi:dUTP pyrophosphatase
MDRVKQLEVIQDEARELFAKKNADYGDAFATYGIVGVLIRIQDKIQRFMSISKSGVQLVDDEGLRDTLLDLHNYAAMGMMLEKRGVDNTDMKLLIKKLSPNAITPTRASPGSVGYDLYSTETMSINARERGIVSTGIATTIPMGVYGRIAPRSGLAVKHGIQTGAGVIDPDYTGELKVILFNHGTERFDVKQGDRIAQLILEKCETPLIEEVSEIKDTQRGNKGFGSSG